MSFCGVKNFRRQPPAARRPRAAMAVVELLIALAIGSLVLVAVAYCTDSAFRAY